MKPDRRRQAKASVDSARESAADSLPVIVPRLERELAPVEPERVRRLRRFLLEALQALAAPRKGLGREPAPLPPDRTGFAARVVQTACGLCQGSCCQHGEDNAYLDERALTRVCAAKPGLSAWAIIRLYTERVPQHGVDGSCIFHGPRGCTLDVPMRSDVCHNYFCYGLERFLALTEAEEPVVIIAGDGRRLRRSPVLVPKDGDEA